MPPLRRAISRRAAVAPVPPRALALTGAIGALAVLSALIIAPARAADSGPLDLTFFGGTAVPPWTAQQTAADDRLTFSDDPHGVWSGKIARFAVHLGDKVGGGNRSEVYYKPGGVGAEANGETSYYGFSVAFPDTVTADGSTVEWTPPKTWGIITQGHAPDTVGTFPVVALETRSDTHLRLAVRGGNPKKSVVKQVDLPIYAKVDGWHDFLLAWTRSSDTTSTTPGVVQLWHRRGDGSFACHVSYRGPNMYRDKRGNTDPAYLKQGIYRDGAKDGTHPTVVQHTGIRKAPTLADAASLFGRPAIEACPDPTA